MTKQELARKRNWIKFQLAGLIKPMPYEVMSDLEKECWNKIKELRTEMLLHFDNTSRQAGLTIYNKCWCGKIAKHKPEEGEYPPTVKYVCKKHIQNV